MKKCPGFGYSKKIIEFSQQAIVIGFGKNVDWSRFQSLGFRKKIISPNTQATEHETKLMAGKI